MEQQLDELMAGSLWRVHKLRSFEETVRPRTSCLGFASTQLKLRENDARAPFLLPQARRLGLLNDPHIQRALCGIAEHTSALEDLARLDFIQLTQHHS
jgi:hypothetical protein